jgi:PAS domain S-box-containing protein
MLRPDGGNYRVLLVEAAGGLERRLGSALTAAGYETESVGSASECLRRVRRGDVDGIVSEYDLPDLDGVRLLRSVRVSYPSLPFVLAPEEGSETIAGDAVAAGVSGYVASEENPDTVVSRLRDTRQTRRGGADESVHRYRHIIEMSPAPINVFDETGESIWGNEAVVDLLDLDDLSGLIGHSIFEFVHPDDHDRARAELASVIENKESTGPTPMRLRTASGDVRYIQVSTAVGEYLGMDIGQAIIVDVTDQKERDRQLQVLEQWLRHNIRNEVTVIHGMAEQIERGAVDDVTTAARRIQEHAGKLVDQANHERAVITLLSDPPDPVRTDLSEAVERSVASVRRDNPDADVELALAGDLIATTIPEIEDAVTELVTNAIRHSDEDSPWVRVETTRDDDHAVVRVADTGPGIPESERNHLLVDRDISPLDHGRGLGLVFVYWVVRLSGGDVSFAENDPRGSVVTAKLPLAE